jgi:cobalt-zinc-cadmium efflux system outer membrane protein
MWALFRQRGEVNAAAAEVRKAEATREALRRTASLDVEVSYSALSTARKRVEAFEGGVLELAKAVYEVASESYRQGKASYLEVLGAQKTLTETKIAYFESIYKYRRARAEMARATGGSL